MGVLSQTCNPRSWEAEAAVSQVLEFKVSLSYIASSSSARISLKKKERKILCPKVMRLVTGKPSISIIAGLPYMLTAGVFTL
jgi:hypothetical protein